MASLVRIMCGDPAEGSDYFAIFGGVVDLQRATILPKYARQWNHTDFTEIARQFEGDYERISPKFFGLETNYKGKEALAAFRARDIDAHGITTCHMLTDRNRRNWKSMDKSYTVSWVKEMKRTHHIMWPIKPTATMKKAEDQVASIRQFRTANGSTSYRALRSRHDDLFMAFLLFCHLARVYIQRYND